MIKYRQKDTGHIYVKHGTMNYIVSEYGMYSMDSLKDDFEMIVDETDDDKFCHLSDDDFIEMIQGWLTGCNKKNKDL